MTFAGNGDRGYSGDGGPAIQAMVDLLHEDYADMFFDSHDNQFFPMGDKIRKVDVSASYRRLYAG